MVLSVQFEVCSVQCVVRSVWCVRIVSDACDLSLWRRGGERLRLWFRDDGLWLQETRLRLRGCEVNDYELSGKRL